MYSKSIDMPQPFALDSAKQLRKINEVVEDILKMLQLFFIRMKQFKIYPATCSTTCSSKAMS